MKNLRKGADSPRARKQRALCRTRNALLFSGQNPIAWLSTWRPRMAPQSLQDTQRITRLDYFRGAGAEPPEFLAPRLDRSRGSAATYSISPSSPWTTCSTCQGLCWRMSRRRQFICSTVMRSTEITAAKVTTLPDFLQRADEAYGFRAPVPHRCCPTGAYLSLAAHVQKLRSGESPNR